MVEVPFFGFRTLISSTLTNYKSPNWFSGTILERTSEFIVPYDGSWKNFSVKVLVANALGTVTIQRRVNNSDVGSPITFTTEGAGTIKEDLTSINVSEGDVLTIRFIDTNSGGTDGVFDMTSVYEVTWPF